MSCTWYAMGDFFTPKLTAQESAALIILAACLLVFRTFRERFLLVWIVGWLAFVVSRWPLPGASRYFVAIAQAEYLLALCLFCAAIFIFTHAKKLLTPLFLTTLALLGYSVFLSLRCPDSMALRIPLEVAYRIVALTAAIQLVRYRWGRWELAPWLLGAIMLLMHLDFPGLHSRVLPSLDLIPQLLLGLSMLLVVLDASRARTRRLTVINNLTGAIARSQQYGPMLQAALEELKALMRARAAWFRLQEGDKMLVVQQIGLSPDFLKAAASVSMDETLQRVLQQGKPAVVKANSCDAETRTYLRQEKFHHVVIVPVLGKKSAIGTLALGSRYRRSYSPEDMDFLATSGQQLGMAVENLRLVEQVLRSQRQWMNTFDSIQDLILVHDADHRMVRANQALLRHLEQSPADIAGKSCHDGLPHFSSARTGRPYCALGGRDRVEGPAPCFGGFSLVSTSFYFEQGSTQKGTIHVVRDTTDRRSAEEKYHRLFEQVQEGVFVATPDGKLIDCNDAFVNMLGYSSRAELAALSVDTELYASPEQREAFRREVARHNYVRNFEVTLRKKDGTLLNAVESSFATRTPEGQVERYQGFLLDMTEKKRAEDEIRRRNRELNALNAMAVIATQSFDLDEILNLSLRQVITLAFDRSTPISARG